MESLLLLPPSMIPLSLPFHKPWPNYTELNVTVRSTALT